jgi:hypothetical protein
MSSGPFSLRNTFKTSEKHSMILFCAQLVAQSCGPPGPETGFEEIGIALPRTGPLENLASRAKAR